MSHFNAKLRSHASISCKGYRDQVEGSLRLLIKTLQGELKKEEQSTHEISSGKNAMVTRCSNLQHAAKGLRYICMCVCVCVCVSIMAIQLIIIIIYFL